MSEQSPEPEQASQESSNPIPKSYERIIARWTVILGASTIALVIATAISAYFLYVTDHTLKDTLAATGRSAKATEDSVKIASDTARRQLRAYIDVTDVKLDCPNCIRTKGGLAPPKKGPAEFRLPLTVKNFGVTPPYQLRACSGTYLTDRDSFPPDDFTYDCGKFCETCPPATIGPGAETLIILPLEVGDVFMSSFGLKRMFNFGAINFKDTFGAIRKHPFCWYFQGENEGDALGCPKNNTDQDD